MDKKPLQSKKFVAYLIADFGWKIILFYTLYHRKDQLDNYSFLFMITLVIVSGFIQVGYILGQAALDKYSQITNSVIMKDKEK